MASHWYARRLGRLPQRAKDGALSLSTTITLLGERQDILGPEAPDSEQRLVPPVLIPVGIAITYGII